MKELTTTTGTTNTIHLVTHGGVFHADDVAATALLQIYLSVKGYRYEVIRTYDPASLGYTDDTPNSIIYDVGGGKFDHHQINDDHIIRTDGLKYSSVGLIWQQIGPNLVGGYADEVYNNFFRYIDDQDNGNGMNPLSWAIRSFENFNTAVLIMKTMITNVILSYRRKIKNEKKINQIINNYYNRNSNSNYIITDEYIDGMVTACSSNEIAFWIYPNERGGYCFRTIPADKNDMMGKHIIDIPQEVRDWDGVTFLHPTAFLGSAETKEKAIEVVEKILSIAL